MHYALKYTLKTQSLFKTEYLRLLCHPICFGLILDPSSGDVPCTMLRSALLLRHNFTWVCGRIFCVVVMYTSLLLVFAAERYT
jgi:hypothetical protein